MIAAVTSSSCYSCWRGSWAHAVESEADVLRCMVGGRSDSQRVDLWLLQRFEVDRTSAAWSSSSVGIASDVNVYCWRMNRHGMPAQTPGLWTWILNQLPLRKSPSWKTQLCQFALNSIQATERLVGLFSCVHVALLGRPQFSEGGLRSAFCWTVSS